MASPEIDALTQALARLPGLGPRSARRAVLHLMKKREAALMPLLKALERVADNLSVCSACGNVDTTDPCSVCADPRRDDRLLCVVEEVSDLWALDRSRLFPGRFHVLGGRLSALEGVRPEDLGIDKLLGRVAKGGIDEVVLAMNATLEGQTTAHYLAERLEGFPIRLTQLAHGLPVGGELDYLDEGTLAQALRARRPVDRRTRPSGTGGRARRRRVGAGLSPLIGAPGASQRASTDASFFGALIPRSWLSPRSRLRRGAVRSRFGEKGRGRLLPCRRACDHGLVRLGMGRRRDPPSQLDRRLHLFHPAAAAMGRPDPRRGARHLVRLARPRKLARPAGGMRGKERGHGAHR